MTTKKKRKKQKLKAQRRKAEKRQLAVVNRQSSIVNSQSEKAPTAQPPPSGWQIRPNDGQGAYSKYFKSYIPRKVEADFYEFLREAIPIIDAAIQRLTELDGHLVVKGSNDALVEEIQEWMDNVTVNDIQKGILAFDQNFTSEAHEQGFVIGEFVTSKKRDDIVGLRVADSKFIKFSRTDKGLEISQKGNDDNEYRTLKPDNLMYFSINNENQNPYGTAMMRSCEFVSKIIVTIQNTIHNLFERFGDPSYKLIYKTSKKDGTNHTTRVTEMKADLNAAITAKRAGNSADFAYVIDKDSSIDISVIGADNKQVLEFKEPMRSAVEQVVAKTGFPPWMLGIQWSTTQNLSDAEANMILAAVKVRQAAKMPVYKGLIKNLLLLRGRTWKQGDWDLEWAQVNLHDIVNLARANFLNSQAEMMNPEKEEKKTPGNRSWDPANKNSHINHSRFSGSPCTCCGKSSIVNRHSSTKELTRPAPWPELDEVEDNFEKGLKYDWSELTVNIFEILKLPTDELAAVPKPTPREEQLVGARSIVPLQAKQPPDISIDAFTYSDEQRALIMKELEDFKGKYDWRGEDSAVQWYYGQSYSLGLIQAANLIGKEQPILSIIKNKEVFDQITKEGFGKIKDNADKAMVKRWFPEIEAQALAGTNPRHVAARLAKLSENKNYDWERLARTEMNIAAEKAKLHEWKEWGIDTANATIAGDDTHPRCRCTNSVKEVDGKWITVFVPAPDACPLCLSFVT